MADNYLERKMEEHRSRCAAVKLSAVRRKGVLTFNFPERRVLVVGGSSPAGREIVKNFSEAGCRVAVIDKGAAEANIAGARCYDANPTDEAEVADAIVRLLDAWDDVDVIVAVDAIVSEEIFNRIADSRGKLPYQNSYRGRLVRIGSRMPFESVAHHGFAVNSIVADCSNGLRREVARLCLFLCVPENDFINGAVIEVNGSKTV